MNWKNYAALHTSLEAAREAFEADCDTLFKSIYTSGRARRVEVKNGDNGVDIFVGDIGINPITVIQCKFFIEDFGDSQKNNIRSSFKTVITSEKFSVKEWFLCIPRRLTVDENIWWENWRKKAVSEYGLEVDQIKLYDGDALIGLFKREGLYERVFKIEDKLLLKDISEKVTDLGKGRHPVIDLASIKRLFKSASFDLECIVGNFGTSSTHVQRQETKDILEWIDRQLQENEKPVLVLEGEKGYGKTIIMKDVLDDLAATGIPVLAIKADRIYAGYRNQLEKLLFQNDTISFETIFNFFRKEKRQFVVIIDQLDALSQTLSSKREYLQTYNRLIADLAAEGFCRVIISARTFDLAYDAGLSIYKGKGYKNIKVSKLTEAQVKEVLGKYGVTGYNGKFLKLLQVPNHLDIFCKLPNKHLVNYNTLSSLKDLYDTLWTQVITTQKTPTLSQLMYILAKSMYSRQQIVAKNVYHDSRDEVNYLISNGLLTEEKGYLQFFHQTFYDYTFSRHFVEQGLSLAAYIKENGQSLYCRSIINMVLNYYRDYNENKYNKTLRTLLRKNYRYHIQSLVVSNLAQMELPTKFEKSCFTTIIAKNRYHIENFINSVSSKGWIQFLLQKDIPLRLLCTQKETFFKKIRNRLLYPQRPKPNINTASWILRLLTSGSAHSMDDIITYISPRFNPGDHNDLIGRFLTINEHWDNEKLLPVFERHMVFDITASKHANFYYFHALEKISEHHYHYVLQQLGPKLNAICREEGEMPYELKKLLEKLISERPHDTIEFMMSIFLPIAEARDIHTDRTYTALYKSQYFGDHTSRLFGKNAAQSLRKLIADGLQGQIQNQQLIKGYFSRLKSSSSKVVVHMLADTLLAAPMTYKDEIYELLTIVHSKHGFADMDDKLQFTLRKLIAKAFKSFTKPERTVIGKIILSVTHPYEKNVYQNTDGKRYHSLRGYGKKKYLFLDALPEKLRDADPSLKKAHQELYRKFGKVTEKHMDVSGVRWGSSAPPLPQSSYEALDDEAWIQTMLKYNDEYPEPFDGGGRREHKNQFTEQVAKDPERFSKLIERLFSIEGISHDYCYGGVEGLIKAKYKPSAILQLYHKLIALPLDIGNTIGVIHQADYLIQNKSADHEVINFLSRSALYHTHPEGILNPDHLFSDSRNSVRGAAVHALVKCYYNASFAETIFNTLEKAAEDPLSIIRIGVLSNLAYLNNLDISRSFKLFQKLTTTDDLDVIDHAFWSAGYYRENFFDQMKPLIEKVIDNEKLHEHGTVFLVHNYLLGYDSRGLDYQRLVRKSKAAKLKAIHVAEENLFFKKQPDQKCLDILLQFLDEADEDFVHPYSTFVLRKAKLSNFEVLFPFLDAYTKTKLFAQDPAYTVQYLNKVAKNYPRQCMVLLRNMDFTSKPDIQKRGFNKDEPIQLVLAVYSYLCAASEKENGAINEALQIFDNMLKLDHLRYAASDALDTLKL